MSCLLIMGTILTSAMTMLPALQLSHQQTQAVNQLVGALNYARTVAVLERRTVTLCSGNGKCAPTKNWQDHLLTFTDMNINGQVDSNEKVLRQYAIQPGYSWQWSNFRNRPFIQLEANGTTRALNGTFTLCHRGIASKQVIVNLTGRTRTQAAPATAVCK